MDTYRGQRRFLGLVGAVVASALVVVSAGGADAATATVDEVGTSFQPAQVEIVVGDSVVWTNRSYTSHSVTFENGPDLHPTCTRGLLGPVGNCQARGATAQYTFTAARNYAYYCKLHDNMRGVVVVSPRAAITTSTTAPPTTLTTRATTTTGRPTSSTTSTSRPLATSSTLAASTTTTTANSSVLLPGDPPPFAGEGSSSSATGDAGGSDDGGDTATVALIVALLLAASAGGGYLLWRLRPSRA